MGEPTRVLIVDDSRIFRAALEQALSGQDDVAVVGSVFSGDKALQQRSTRDQSQSARRRKARACRDKPEIFVINVGHCHRAGADCERGECRFVGASEAGRCQERLHHAGRGDGRYQR